MKNTTKTFLFLYPDDPYFGVILSRLMSEISKLYPDHLLLVSPVWGIDFHKSLSFRPISVAKFIKKYFVYIINQIRLQSKVKRSIASFLGGELPENLKIIGIFEYLFYSTQFRYKSREFGTFLNVEDGYMIEDIKAGDLIIDTFLRFKPSPSFQPSHPFVAKLLKLSFRYISYFNHLYDRFDVKGVFGSYTTYIYHGIPLRMAQSRDIDVTTFGGRFTFYKYHSPSAFLSHHVDHTVYTNKPIANDKLAVNAAALSHSKISLENRINGRQDDSIIYMNQFSDSTDFSDVVNDCYIIFLHDFFDSPHIYRWMLHTDFYHWLTDTIEILTNAGAKVFIKPHPNQSSASTKVVASLIKFYDQNKLVFWITEKVSNSTILKQYPKLVVSVYGSVLVEAAYCGIRSISAGDHPAFNFNISYNPLNLYDYKEKLLDPSLILPPSQQDAIQFVAQQRISHTEGVNPSLINYLDCSWDTLYSDISILQSNKVSDFIDRSISMFLELHSF